MFIVIVYGINHIHLYCCSGPPNATSAFVAVRDMIHTLLCVRTFARTHAQKPEFVSVLTDPHTDKAFVVANESRNMRSNIKRSACPAIRAAYRSLAAFFIDLRPK